MELVKEPIRHSNNTFKSSVGRKKTTGMNGSPHTVHKEFMAVSNDKENAIRFAHRIHPTNPPTNQKNQHLFPRRMTLTHIRSQKRRPRGTT
jgi:hypothetical protein